MAPRLRWAPRLPGGASGKEPGPERVQRLGTCLERDEGKPPDSLSNCPDRKEHYAAVNNFEEKTYDNLVLNDLLNFPQNKNKSVDRQPEHRLR